MISAITPIPYAWLDVDALIIFSTSQVLIKFV